MKSKIGDWLGFFAVIAVLSIPVSFVHALGNDGKTCKTNGRYLPVTLLFCKLSEPLK